jgi:predicted RNA-binding Zn ribbon-like protein
MPRCAGVTAANEPCSRLVSEGVPFCHAHDPDKAEARKKAASKAARSVSRNAKTELKDAKNTLREITRRVDAGELDTRKAAVMIQAQNAIIRALSTEVQIIDQQEVLTKLDKLERGELSQEEVY